MKKNLIKISYIVLSLICVLLVFDKIVMPWYVSSDEETIPNFIGMHKDEAKKTLERMNLVPIIIGPRYDNYNPLEKDFILRQRPHPGMKVKHHRRVYIFYSGGDPKITMPDLIGKSQREAELILKNLELTIGEINNIRSEYPSNTVVEQQVPVGKQLNRGSIVNITISTGPELGYLKTPDLTGLSLTQARDLLKEHSIFIGRIEYQESSSLMPNTVISHYPNAESLISPFDSVNVVISKSKRN